MSAEVASLNVKSRRWEMMFGSKIRLSLVRFPLRTRRDPLIFMPLGPRRGGYRAPMAGTIGLSGIGSAWGRLWVAAGPLLVDLCAYRHLAQVEAVVKPDRVLDDLGWEPVPPVGTRSALHPVIVGSGGLTWQYRSSVSPRSGADLAVRAALNGRRPRQWRGLLR